MLRGEALMEGSAGAEDCILALSVADLPTEPGARFTELFAARPQWELHDLEPYLADLQVSTQLLSDVLPAGLETARTLAYPDNTPRLCRHSAICLLPCSTPRCLVLCSLPCLPELQTCLAKASLVDMQTNRTACQGAQQRQIWGHVPV